MEKRIFKLDELDDEFWEKVIFINIWNSTGMGGPGSLWIITSDKKLFFIGYEGLPYSEFKLGEFSPLLRKKEEIINGRRPYVVEDEGWHFIQKNVLVRDDFYEDFMQVYKDKIRREGLSWKYVHMPAIAGLALGLDGEPERYNEEKTYQLWKERDEALKEWERKRAAVALDADDLIWKRIYANNNPANEFLFGEYALLFRDCEEKTIGYKLTIKYQRKELEPFGLAGKNAPIERYNLFEWKYNDVIGPLSHEESRYDNAYRQAFGGDTNTLHNCEINSPGQFVRSFATIEEAKKYALALVNCRHYVDKETIIRDLDNEDRVYRSYLRKYEALLAFRENYRDILEIVCDYEYKNRCTAGGGYIAEAIREKLGIDKALLGEMWNYIPLELSKETQEKARAIVQDCKEYFDQRK